MLQKRKQEIRHVKQKKARLRSILFVLAVDLGLGAAILAGSLKLRQKQLAYQQEVEILQEKIEDEEVRSKEIEQLEEYIKTDAYIEDVAREKLGLAYKNEILLKEAR